MTYGNTDSESYDSGKKMGKLGAYATLLAASLPVRVVPSRLVKRAYSSLGDLPVEGGDYTGFASEGSELMGAFALFDLAARTGNEGYAGVGFLLALDGLYRVLGGMERKVWPATAPLDVAEGVYNLVADLKE